MTGTTSGSRLDLPRYAHTDAGLRTPVGYADYKSTGLRAPLRTPVDLPHRLTEITGPVLGEDRVRPEDADLTLRNGGEAVGQRILFYGLGRVMTDSLGRYEFMTIKPGAYPWGNHHNAWRPAPIHFSLFGRAFTQRLVTQMYFPDDPLFGQDPIYNSVPEAARERMVSTFDLEATQDNWALAFQWDIVLRGSGQTPFEADDDGDVA